MAGKTTVSPLPTDQGNLQQLLRDAIYLTGATRVESEEHRLLELEQYLCSGAYVTFDDAHVTLRYKDDSIIAYSWTVAGLHLLMAELKRLYDEYVEQLANEAQCHIDDELFTYIDDDYVVDKSRFNNETEALEFLKQYGIKRVACPENLIRTTQSLSQHPQEIRDAVRYLTGMCGYAWEQSYPQGDFTK